MRPNLAQRKPEFDFSQEATARALLCEAFHVLVQEQHETVVAAAWKLGVPPATVSGKASLPARYKAGGVRALMMQHRPPKWSRVSAAANRLRESLLEGGKI